MTLIYRSIVGLDILWFFGGSLKSPNGSKLLAAPRSLKSFVAGIKLGSWGCHLKSQTENLRHPKEAPSTKIVVCGLADLAVMKCPMGKLGNEHICSHGKINIGLINSWKILINDDQPTNWRQQLYPLSTSTTYRAFTRVAKTSRACPPTTFRCWKDWALQRWPKGFYCSPSSCSSTSLQPQPTWTWGGQGPSWSWPWEVSQPWPWEVSKPSRSSCWEVPRKGAANLFELLKEEVLSKGHGTFTPKSLSSTFSAPAPAGLVDAADATYESIKAAYQLYLQKQTAIWGKHPTAAVSSPDLYNSNGLLQLSTGYNLVLFVFLITTVVMAHDMRFTFFVGNPCARRYCSSCVDVPTTAMSKCDGVPILYFTWGLRWDMKLEGGWQRHSYKSLHHLCSKDL